MAVIWVPVTGGWMTMTTLDVNVEVTLYVGWDVTPWSLGGAPKPLVRPHQSKAEWLTAVVAPVFPRFMNVVAGVQVSVPEALTTLDTCRERPASLGTVPMVVVQEIAVVPAAVPCATTGVAGSWPVTSTSSQDICADAAVPVMVAVKVGAASAPVAVRCQIDVSATDDAVTEVIWVQVAPVLEIAPAVVVPYAVTIAMRRCPAVRG